MNCEDLVAIGTLLDLRVTLPSSVLDIYPEETVVIGGGGGGGGGGSNPAGLNTGCGSAAQTAGKVYSQLNSSDSSIFNTPGSGSNGQEAFGWIYQNNSSGAFVYTTPAVDSLSSSGTIAVGNPPAYTGYTFEGTYHTHPFNPEDPTMTDSTTATIFL
jgi:hypothetical protein